jgi:hypothetical protein
MMNSEQAAIGVAITRTRYDAEADCVVVEEVDPLDWYAEDVRPAAVHIAASELYKTRIDAINAQVNAMLARGPLAVIDKIDPVKLEQHKRLVAEKRRVGRVEVTVLDEAAEISQQAWEKIDLAMPARLNEQLDAHRRAMSQPRVFRSASDILRDERQKELIEALHRVANPPVVERDVRVKRIHAPDIVRLMDEYRKAGHVEPVEPSSDPIALGPIEIALPPMTDAERAEKSDIITPLVIALAPPEPEKPRKLHEEYTLDDWRRGIANSSRQYHGT